MSHTPAPWSNVCFQVYGPRREKICHTGLGNLPPSRSHESEANATLISAAPDYAAAVEHLLAYEQAGGDGWWRTGWEMLKSAHAKATKPPTR